MQVIIPGTGRTARGRVIGVGTSFKFQASAFGAIAHRPLCRETHRGLRGRVEDGKSGDGLCYGYKVVKTLDERGEPVRGDREIDEVEASVVRRIFRDFAAGIGPRTIAKTLNDEGVPGPQGKLWSDTTIRGHVKRGTGIINNELYIGRLIWNRLRYVKDPSTGKRVSRLNPQDAWKAELTKVEKEIRGIIKAIKEGMFHASMKAEMDTLEARKAELTTLLADVPEDTPDLLPSASSIYAKKVGRLTEALNRPEERVEAAEALRTLIEKIVLTPGPNRGEIDALLYGELGTIMNWIERQAVGKAAKNNTPGAGLTGASVSLVAGARYPLYRNRRKWIRSRRTSAPK